MPFSPCWLPLKTKKPPAWRRSGEAAARHGLSVTPEEALALANTHRQALHDAGRIEISGTVLPKLAASFAASPYAPSNGFALLLGELCGWFYHFKNTSLEPVGDDGLVALDAVRLRPSLHGAAGAVAAGVGTPPGPGRRQLFRPPRLVRRLKNGGQATPKIRTGEGLPAARLSPPAYLLPGPAGRAGPAPGTPQAGGRLCHFERRR